MFPSITLKPVKLLPVILLILAVLKSPAQTKAHLLSKSAVIDPAYNAMQVFPNPGIKKGAPWLYGYSELECWKLMQIRKEDKDARLKVGYPGDYHVPYKKVSFKFIANKNVLVNKISFYATGDVQVFADDRLVYTASGKNSVHNVSLAKLTALKQLQVNLSTNGEPPCLLIAHGPVTTAGKNWQWQAEGEPWQQPAAFPQLLNGARPHQNGLNQLQLNPVKGTNSVYDFGRELLGYVTIQSATKPQFGIGESIAEATDTTTKNMEQTVELVDEGNGKWRSKVPLAFRYVKATAEEPVKVSCEALFYPAQYKGAFASSDTLLTRIWMNSAYTLRLCMHDFLIDGVKRDRLPWAGDLAMSMQADAYSFADKEVVRKSLVVLGRAGISTKDVNGIIDYSLWWIISQHLYQLYHGDVGHLKKEWPRIKEALNILNSRCDSAGYINSKNTWLFIDWVDGNKNTALQVLWWWAQQSGARLAQRMGDNKAMQLWNSRSAILKKRLLKDAWSVSKGAWMNDPYHPDTISRHANILALLSGLADSQQYPQIGKVLRGHEAAPVGTPYMAGFENMALARTGDIQRFIGNVKDYWGGMLNYGATTFWEAYDPAQKGTERLAFYDRPYGKSLCHAWSSGPAAFLPAEISGIKPLADGWKIFSIDPHPGNIKWIDATIPTPHGDITVEIKDNAFTIQIPAGTAGKWKGKLIYGPKTLNAKL